MILRVKHRSRCCASRYFKEGIPEKAKEEVEVRWRMYRLMVGSFHADVRHLDHFAPLFDFAGHKLAKLSWRASNGCAT